MGQDKSQENFWSWKADDADIENQIVNYKSLKITESYRGISVLIISGLLIFSFILSIFGAYADTETMVYAIIIYIPVLFFVYKGHRWAIILLMIMWTFEKGVSFIEIVDSGKGSVAGTIFWWAIIMPYFWKALRVENERRKRTKPEEKLENIQPSFINNDVAKGKNFCSSCGKEINHDGNFCKFCGNQLK